MGSFCCGSSDAYSKLLEKQMDIEIQEHMKECKRQNQNEKKLLLLGTDNSGKSTLFKDLRLIDGQRFQEREKLRSKQLIRQTMVSMMIALLQTSVTLHNDDPSEVAFHQIDFEREDVSDYIKTLLKFSGTNFADEEEVDNTSLENLGTAMESLWKMSLVKTTFTQKSKWYFQDNLDYFFSKAKTIMHCDYVPDNDDILRIRSDSVGVQEMVFEKWGTIFRIYDIGGLYNECNRWTFEIFEHVHVVVYVAALNHFEYVSLEKEPKNLMHAALDMFDHVCNTKWFEQADLKKKKKKRKNMPTKTNTNEITQTHVCEYDLFREAIGTGSSLQVCFSHEKTGWSGEEWNTRFDYSPKTDAPYTEDPLFLTSYNAALDFIRNQFLQLNRVNKEIFSHTTCATDTRQIDIIVGDVQDFIIRNNLKKGGLII
ncbi:hypothetical protein RFI_07377 [Reticulomyxa filosa]|uniref:Uncharacterized protein n=1 Tax=Reticulomyxa filosa TaxID=46433 RepID=X6NUN9_RETFI|nr:hypothetical protein RFI_07377 [Reticulomyxa filosa]|eukprot:ETO29741.1 hypothetical protein RFI_07377 [Reticulomyxa filosa]